MASDLKSLLDIISSSVDAIDAVCVEMGKPFPSLNEPLHPSEFSPEGIRNHPEIMNSINLIIAAATQLVATIQPPPTTLAIAAFGFTLPAALGVAEAANVAEIIRKAGPKGMHVDEIASQSGTDPRKLSRTLRYLATNHWFREVTPDVFAHNLLSSMLDTGKEISSDFASTKHQNTHGLAAIVAYGADTAMKASAYLPETLTDPATALSQEPIHCAVQKALGTNRSFFEYFDEPEGRHRGQVFAMVMAGASKMQPPEAIMAGFDWSSVPKNGLIIDVGCGLGHVSLEIARARPDLNFVLEDRQLVIDQAKDNWQRNLPSHIADGKVQFHGIDFFSKQPTLPGTPDVFLLRQIVHDWSDKYAIRLLQQLREAAGLNTKLLFVDCVVGYACNDPGVDQPENSVPKPLLPNLGGANLLTYSVDMVVMSVLNAGERTIHRFIDVIEAGGWKFVEIRRNPASKTFWPSIISIPT